MDDFLYTVVGARPERKNLETLASDLDLKHRVRFTGRVERVEEHYRKAEVFVMTTREEIVQAVTDYQAGRFGSSLG